MAAPNRIEHNPALVPPLQPAAPRGAESGVKRTADGKTFDEILRTKVGEKIGTTGAPLQEVAGEPISVRWSAHAAARLKQRGISLSDTQLARLETAVDKAAGKGARDALVMMDDTAMVVSVKNRTVITALAKDQARDNVFTNIDSAVIA
jgi:flagellar operon protein